MLISSADATDMAPPKLPPAEVCFEDPSVRVFWKPSGECWLQRERADRNAYAQAVAARAEREEEGGGLDGGGGGGTDGGAVAAPPPPAPPPASPPPAALDFGLSKVTTLVLGHLATKPRGLTLHADIPSTLLPAVGDRRLGALAEGQNVARRADRAGKNGQDHRDVQSHRARGAG